jgi:hypothetical protein
VTHRSIPMLRWICASLVTATAAAAAPLPAHYAPLFEKGKTWVYDTRHITFGAEDDKTGKPTHLTERDKVTCKVIEVTRRAGAAVSHITCDKDLGRKFDLAGFWIGTDKGLWRSAEDQAPDAGAIEDLQKAPMRIAGQPKVFEKIIHEGIDPKHDTILIGVRESSKIKGWCAYEDTTNADPDGGHVSVCYGADLGIESGYDDVGGSLDKLEYTVRR